MFTLYRIVKRSVAETVPNKASVHTGNATFGTISAPEQDYFAQFLKDLIPETQQSTCFCSHCTGSVSATLRFTIRYSADIALFREPPRLAFNLLEKLLAKQKLAKSKLQLSSLLSI